MARANYLEMVVGETDKRLEIVLIERMGTESGLMLYLPYLKKIKYSR
jgi:hypothetical protein